MTSKPIIIIESGVTTLARKGAEIFSQAASETVAKSGRFAVAISGGSTPRSMHRLLGEHPFKSAIPWDKTDLFWVDERCVAKNHPDSNFGAAKKDFLARVPIPRGHIHPLRDDLSPEEGARWYQQKLVTFFQLKEHEFPLFDLIFLGIGTDGHTASLFPGQSALNEMKRWVVAVKGGKPDVRRLTLTFPVINRGKQIVFMISGKQKASVVKSALTGIPSGLPAQRVQPITGKLIWLLDREAASLLE
ncbi:MAG: 6-phosphogluconolactonase [Thermodesulfobacteriota bacterium]|nr:6-phosphogluconolactonase [Thermodesulfobacteriota bacterium]